jgi:uncharacterized membrane protein
MFSTKHTSIWLTLFFLVSIFGVNLVTYFDENIIILLWLIIYPFYVLLIRKNLKNIDLFIISLNLSLLIPFRVLHLLGSDVHESYYLFMNVLLNNNWIVENHLLSTMINISILPSIFQMVTNISPENTFIYLYPTIYSVTPLVIYKITTSYFTHKTSFWSYAFFISFINFMYSISNPRTFLAILFLSLLIYVNSLKNNHNANLLLSTMFFIGMLFTHYTTTIIFLFIYGVYSFINYILYKKYNEITVFVSMLSLTFIWYRYESSRIFFDIIFVVKQIMVQGNNNQVMTSIDQVFGASINTLSVAALIELSVIWIINLLVLLGFIYVAFSFIKTYPINNKINDLFMLLIPALLMIIILVVYSRISIYYSITRAYTAIYSVVLPSMIIGSIHFSKMISKIIPKIDHTLLTPHTIQLLLFVFIFLSLFFSSYGITYYFSGVQRLIYSNTGSDYENHYVQDSQSYSANWLSYYTSDLTIHTQSKNRKMLHSQGHIPLSNLLSIQSKTLQKDITHYSKIYDSGKIPMYQIASEKMILYGLELKSFQ